MARYLGDRRYSGEELRDVPSCAPFKEISLLPLLSADRRWVPPEADSSPKAATPQEVPEKVKVFGPGVYAHYLNIAWQMQRPSRLGELPPLRYSRFAVEGTSIPPDQLKLELPQGQGGHPLHERIYALLNSSDPLPSPERPPEARPVRWSDGTEVWITPGTREMTAYGRGQLEDDTCGLMTTKSVLHRQVDPHQRLSSLDEKALIDRASAMGAYHPSMIYHSSQGDKTYIYQDTSLSLLPDLWRSLGSGGQYVGIRCQQQDLPQITGRVVEMMSLLHSEGYDTVTRVTRGRESQAIRDTEGKEIRTPSETIAMNGATHTIPIIGFAYQYEKEKATDNKLVGAILNDSYVGALRERIADSENFREYRPLHLGAGIAIGREILEADLFALTPPGLKLYDGYDCVMQLVITERALPR